MFYYKLGCNRSLMASNTIMWKWLVTDVEILEVLVEPLRNESYNRYRVLTERVNCSQLCVCARAHIYVVYRVYKRNK